jgi:hypothetical protein
LLADVTDFCWTFRDLVYSSKTTSSVTTQVVGRRSLTKVGDVSKSAQFHLRLGALHVVRDIQGGIFDSNRTRKTTMQPVSIHAPTPFVAPMWKLLLVAACYVAQFLSTFTKLVARKKSSKVRFLPQKWTRPRLLISNARTPELNICAFPVRIRTFSGSCNFVWLFHKPISNSTLACSTVPIAEPHPPINTQQTQNNKNIAGRNVSTNGWSQCLLSTATGKPYGASTSPPPGGMTRDQIVAPFHSSFASVSDGGCPAPTMLN